MLQDTLYQHELGEHESNKLLEKISSIELNTDKEQNSKNTSNELCHEDLDTEETKNDSSLSIKVDNVITIKLNFSYVHTMTLKC